jgi:EAL domain-containing protein (putative c-di-GMP-specific phosphodiesterase class I)
MSASEITKLIKENLLYCEYQPLANSGNTSIYAYEALMRSKPRIAPPIIFQHARCNGDLYELDTVCITNAIKEYPHTYLEKQFLFINILPSTIVHNEFENFIRNLLVHYPHIRGRIIFEINEDSNEEEIWKQEAFLKGLSFLKSHGFSIAFDDLPVAKTSFERMEAISPDFIKLDHTKAQGLSNSIEKQQTISLFLEYTNEKTKLVLEGIETDADLLTAKRLGVHLLQGYFISKPKLLS